MVDEQVRTTIAKLLAATVQMGASDLHITTQSPPQVRVDGELRRLPMQLLSPAESKALIYSVMADAQKKRFEEHRELDFSFGVKGLGRFRCNVFNQRGAVAAVYRLIPDQIKTMRELGLPAIVNRLAERPRGLVLVTGPTGSGKSTTLAAVIDKINSERSGHILTIEDPIEYIHPHKSCLVNQREIHSDTFGFSQALRAALREDPDVVLIGEMRDLETVEAALRIAETGHLTFGTLHTNSAPQTINRIIDIFPSHQQSQIRTQLSMVLEGIVCQTLIPKRSGQGRVAALEVLIPTPGIRNLIREDKIHQIYSAMQTGQAKAGTQTFNQALATLYQEGKISIEAALAVSSLPDELQDMVNRGVGVVARPVPGRAVGPRGVGVATRGVARPGPAGSEAPDRVRAGAAPGGTTRRW